MHYEINVARNGHHYFATTERSLRDEAKAALTFRDFKERFPESEGFSVTCTMFETVGSRAPFDKE